MKDLFAAVMPMLPGARQVLRGRPDSEHEMSFNRLIFAIIISSFVLAMGHAIPQSALIGMAVYIVLCLGILLDIVVHPASSNTRRAIALLLDSTFLSVQLHLGGSNLALFFPIYLWITFGNGFRFGLEWLRASMLTTFVCFLGVVLTTSFWRHDIYLSCGLLAGLIALPLYAGTLIRRLSQARLQAEQANESKTVFLASVSHELRTPLNAIIGMSSLLQDSPLNFEQLEMTQTVQSAAKSLLGLINGVLDLSRIEVGRMPAEPVSFDLVEFLREGLSMVTAQTRAKGLLLTYNIAPDVPLSLIGSRRHMAEILLNLLGNAVKFTEAGSIQVVVSTAERRDQTVRLRLDVRDTGIGISPDAQARIFDTFTQADSTILNRYGGTGLGLSIARKLTQLLGGELTVHSELSAGTTFSLLVTMQVDGGAEAPQLGGYTALLVSADSSDRDRLANQLVSLGLRVETAGRPEQAFWMMRNRRASNESRCVMVVVEEGLPWEMKRVVHELRQLSALAEQPAILLSAAEPIGDNALRDFFVATLRPDYTELYLSNAIRAAVGRGLTRHDLPATVRSIAPSARALSILVADDNAINQQVVSKILARAGHRTHCVSNGEEALEALDESSQDYDLVFMDINMPEMNGLEVVKLYKFMALGRPHLPIVALTADSSSELQKLCIDSGMEAVVTKPVEPEYLLNLVAKLTRSDDVQTQAVAPVASISDHPRFRTSLAGLLDEHALNALRDIGGADFASKLVREFLLDGERAVSALAEAASQGDLRSFRRHAHALRSSAVNVGARRIGELCDVWQKISLIELNREGAQIPQLAATALEQTRQAFERPQLTATITELNR